jgi:hypothetical protein
LFPYSLRLGFNTRYTIQDHNSAIQHTDGSFDFDREIDVAGCIDEVETVVVPEEGDAGGGDGDASFAFGGEVVRDGRARVHVCCVG